MCCIFMHCQIDHVTRTPTFLFSLCSDVCYIVLQFFAVCCSALQYVAVVAVYCNVLQYVAVSHSRRQIHVDLFVSGLLKCVAACCGAMQSVAACCSLWWHVAVCCRILRRVAACCSMLRCAATCCSMLQRVAVCFSTLQCVVVHCSTSQCVVVLRNMNTLAAVADRRKCDAVWRRDCIVEL